MELLSLQPQLGSLCHACGKGILRIKYGKYGAFLGCNRFPKCLGKVSISTKLEAQATKLLDVKKKRAKKKKKSRGRGERWKKEVETAMRKHKKERAEMYKTFIRLVEKE